MRKKILIAGVAIIATQFFCFAQAPSAFKHPGVLSGQAELDALKTAVANNDGSPRVTGYNKLAAESMGSTSYKPTPFTDVHVIASGTNNEETAFRRDAHALYIQSIKWVVTGNTAYRDKAIQIANAWSGTLHSIVSETDHPNQGTLESSWALPIWVAGAEILKNYNNGASGWAASDITQFKSFVNKLLTYVNGPIASAPNWYISKYLSLMSAGVFLDNTSLYNSGYNGVAGQIDAITINGVIPELTRDFVHSQYVLIGMSQCAEVAYQQGDTKLFTRSGARLRISAEAYVQSVTDVIAPKYFSSSDWARQSAPYEILLNRYTALGMQVPNVQNYVVSYNRPENGSEDHFVGWLSATHAISVTGTISADDVPGNIAFKKKITASSEPQPENPATSAVDNNIFTRWSAAGYPQSIEVDLDAIESINKTAVIFYDNRAYQFKIEVRKTETDDYVMVVDRSANTNPGSESEPITDQFTSVEARFVRLTITGAADYTGTWASITEFRIYKSDGTATGLNNPELKPKVYPNPATDFLHFSGKSLINTIHVYDSLGSVVLNSASVNAFTASLNISTFMPGMYLYRISDYNGNTDSGRIIVK